MAPNLKQVFESAINQTASYIYFGIAIGLIAGLVWKLKGWLLGLPFKLFKLLAYYVIEWKGRIESRSSREIIQTIRKTSKSIDLVEAAKGTADEYSSIKKQFYSHGVSVPKNKF